MSRLPCPQPGVTPAPAALSASELGHGFQGPGAPAHGGLCGVRGWPLDIYSHRASRLTVPAVGPGSGDSTAVVSWELAAAPRLSWEGGPAPATGSPRALSRTWLEAGEAAAVLRPPSPPPPVPRDLWHSGPRRGCRGEGATDWRRAHGRAGCQGQGPRGASVSLPRLHFGPCAALPWLALSTHGQQPRLPPAREGLGWEGLRRRAGGPNTPAPAEPTLTWF